MSGFLLFALGFLCGASLVLALRKGSGTRDLTGPPPRVPSPSRPPPIDTGPVTVQVRTEAHTDDQILDMVRRGDKIQAIKRMRELTGMGLAESKDAVEAIERTLR
ncbi:MAG: ribosomal protein L7/L12 [Sphingopyxis sp.]|nr:ribosomal protein L7/L12 [Sphingopyxis sp.]